MSWRSNKSEKYNRSEETEYWQQLVCEQDEAFSFNGAWHWYDDDNDDRWAWFSYYGAPGYVQDMGEYHLLKAMTLLHKLDVRSAKDILTNHGW